ncbi:MAG: AAA family ATPase [Ilumatobacteraceae bacterium]
MWIQPTARRFTSEGVLAEEEYVLTWAMAQVPEPSPSTTVDRDDLDVLQAAAAAVVAGDDRLVLVVGPAGAGKTRMLAHAAVDLHEDFRDVFGLAPTAKAARVLERDTGIHADTVAKLLHEWRRTDRPPDPLYRLPADTTVIVDEAGAISTPALYELVRLAERQRWRLVLVGDHRQLQAVGRGGLFAELCSNGRVERLEHLHRFRHEWEAAASLKLRSGDPAALDAYEAHGRIVAGCLEDHLARMAITWIGAHHAGDSVALVASTNDHVDLIDRYVQVLRCRIGELDERHAVGIGGGERAHVGDVVAIRRNDRTLTTTTGDPVRNRETWIVTGLGTDGSLAVTRRQGHGSVKLPVEYVRQHVRLGYAATEHGWQSDTVTASIALASRETTRRGLYVAATRGRDRNTICVVTASTDVAAARNVLENVLAADRDDVPDVTQRRTLAAINQPRPQPAPAPRCHIPEWFFELRHETTIALRHAEHGAAADVERRRQHEVRRGGLQQERATVAADYSPHEARLADARAVVDYARSRLEASYENLQGAGLGHRRTARHLVDTNKERLDAAQAARQRVEANAEPVRQRLANLDRQLHDFDPDRALIQILDSWAHQSHPHHDPDQLIELDTALNSWQRWPAATPSPSPNSTTPSSSSKTPAAAPAQPPTERSAMPPDPGRPTSALNCRHPCATSSTRHPPQACRSTSSCRGAPPVRSAIERRLRGQRAVGASMSAVRGRSGALTSGVRERARYHSPDGPASLGEVGSQRTGPAAL